jgi:hypothetical protein
VAFFAIFNMTLFDAITGSYFMNVRDIINSGKETANQSHRLGSLEFSSMKFMLKKDVVKEIGMKMKAMRVNFATPACAIASRDSTIAFFIIICMPPLHVSEMFCAR